MVFLSLEILSLHSIPMLCTQWTVPPLTTSNEVFVDSQPHKAFVIRMSFVSPNTLSWLHVPQLQLTVCGTVETHYYPYRSKPKFAICSATVSLEASQIYCKFWHKLLTQHTHLRRDNLIWADVLDIWNGLTVSLQQMQRLFWVAQVHTMNGMVYMGGRKCQLNWPIR